MKKRSVRWMAYLLAMTLFAGILGGCGKEDGESTAPSDTGDVPSEDSVKGRYVEQQEVLPEELKDWSIAQMYEIEGKLRFVTTGQEEGKTILREWEMQEEGLVDVTQEWLASMALSCGDWVDVRLVQGNGGTQYLYTGYVAEGEENYKSHLWKGDGGAAKEITPEKWTVQNEMWGGYEMIQGLAALDNGTLMTYSYTSVDILDGEDGSVKESESVSYLYEGNAVTDGENVYLFAGTQIEKRREGRGENVETIPYPVAGGSSSLVTAGSSSIAFGGEGGLMLGILKDGTLIAAGEDGIFRRTGTAEDAGWEQLAEGVDTDFALKDYQCKDLTVLEDGVIYALFMVNGTPKLNRYVYDPEAVSEVTQVLKLYTVYENPTLKQAAAMYHKAHPEVLINIEYEYPMYFLGQENYDDVYKKLNTMLMGEDAPDLLVTDYLKADSYGSKGLLTDLEDVVKPLEEQGDLLSNITRTYLREDGHRYVVPLWFEVPLAMGRDIKAEDMGSMESLAKFLANAEGSYMGPQTAAELVDIFYPYFCGEIVRDKKLDKEAMGRYLEYLKAIGDNCGIMASRPENDSYDGMWELGAEAKLAFEKVGGFTGCMFPMSMVEYIKGEYAAFEDMFYPVTQMGICSRSKYQDTAKDFLKFVLSEQVQDMDNYDWFPVNRNSLVTQSQKDRSDYMAVVSFIADDGQYTHFESKPYSQETAAQLVKLCEALKKPVKEDAKIREVLTECLGGYLDGTQSKEDTIQKIEAGLKMYLAE